MSSYVSSNGLKYSIYDSDEKNSDGSKKLWYESMITIKSMVPASDWFALCDWPFRSRLVEIPIVAFANYIIETKYTDYEEPDGICEGIGAVVEDWSNGNGGIDFAVITQDNKSAHGIVEIYKGSGNHQCDTLVKQKS